MYNFRDGATCSGLFIAISNLIDQLQQEEELDICNAVRQIQIRRPQCIKDKVSVNHVLHQNFIIIIVHYTHCSRSL